MTSTSWNKNSRGVGGLKRKCLPWGYGSFLELHNVNIYLNAVKAKKCSFGIAEKIATS